MVGMWLKLSPEVWPEFLHVALFFLPLTFTIITTAPLKKEIMPIIKQTLMNKTSRNVKLEKFQASSRYENNIIYTLAATNGFSTQDNFYHRIGEYLLECNNGFT